VATAILVHGLWYGPVSMALVRLRLDRAGFQCRPFSFPSLKGSLATHARALRDFAAESSTDSPVHLVGHSLGGLVILRALHNFDQLPPGRVVLMGTPVQGSEVSRRVGLRRPLRPFLGDSRYALEEGFAHCPPEREIGVIAGTAGVGIGLAFGGLEGPHDGTVAVSETTLEGASDSVCLNVSHTGLVTSSLVTDAVAGFLEKGRFPRQTDSA